jgi:hypothetical protein
MSTKTINFDKFNRFRNLYRSPEWAGAATILNRSFDFDLLQIVPLSISHGVDFGMCFDAMDIYQPEPLHWAYNDYIYQQSKFIKPAIKLPHPWWFVVKDLESAVNDRILLIGPPPGKLNDENLLNIVNNNFELSQIDILIKYRGKQERSIDFWKSNNVTSFTAGPSDEGFYYRLFEILSNYNIIICPLFSSAAIFAASIGKKVIFLEGYKCKFYDTYNYMEVMNFDSIIAKEVVSTFLGGNQSEITKISQFLLGFTDEPIEKLKKRYIEEISKLKYPTFQQSFLSPILGEIAQKIGKPGIANLKLKNFFKMRLHQKKVLEIEVDELSIWKNGINQKNFNIKSVNYIKGVTEPGYAINN